MKQILVTLLAVWLWLCGVRADTTVFQPTTYATPATLTIQTGVSLLGTWDFTGATVSNIPASAITGGSAIWQLHTANLDGWSAKTPYVGSLTITSGQTLNVTGGGTIASGSAAYSAASAFAVAAAAVPTGGATGTVLQKNSATNYDASWNARPVYAAMQTSLLNPAGTTNTVLPRTMAGLAIVFTPTASGKVLVTIVGSMGNNAINGGGEVVIYWGTGTGPVNGATATGTAVGGVAQRRGNWPTASLTVPFSLSAVVNGLTVGTPIWLDLGQIASGAGTFNVQNVAVTATELP